MIALAPPAIAVETTPWRALGDGLVFELADGSALRLAELAPDLAAASLASHVQPGEVTFAAVGTADRSGRLPAKLWQGGGDTLQERLVAAGVARVWPEHDEPFARRLLDLEDEAREAGRGGWGDGSFRILPAAPPPDVLGFAILRGRVISVGRTERFLYLNFGRAYRSSTSVRLRPRDAKAWDLTAQIDALVGRVVEVRGFVFTDGGPMLELDHPAQLRVVE